MNEKYEKPPIVRLNLFLFKASVSDFDECLKAEEKKKVKEFKLTGSYKAKGSFYLKSARPKPLSWLGYVSPVVESGQDLAKLFSTFASGLLFLKCSGRMFAFAFGGGRNLLSAGAYERDFGLKVALNSIDPSKLRSLDVRNLDDVGLQTRKQAGQNSGLEVFGLDIERDFLRAVTGIPDDWRSVERISGRESLQVHTRTASCDLLELCSDSLKRYRKTKYKEHFEWIDDLSPISDPLMKGELNDKLANLLSERKSDGIHLAFPEILNPEEQHLFRYTGQTRGDNREFHDLHLDDLYGILPDTFLFTVPTLKSFAIKAKPLSSDRYLSLWRLWDCLVAQVRLQNNTYVLSLGQWFKVKDDLVSDAKKFVSARYTSTHSFPKHRKNEKENAYNKRASSVCDHALFDMKTTTVPGASTPIEVSDLFGRGKELVHIKRKSRSATLSHLFSQGYVSGISLVDIEAFRGHARKLLVKEGFPKNLISLKSFAPNKYRVRFALMVRKKGAIEEQLPFFSQVNFRQTARALERLGYKVDLLRIDEA